jgi:nucleoside-diphosphate-sugar epimerase
VLTGEKILVTGPAGRIAHGVTAALARDNEVWGIARFSDPVQRKEIENLGVTTRPVDLMTCDFGDLPTDFTYLLHIAASFEDGPFDTALRVNAEATGFLLEHCRSAKAALIMSSVTVYKPHEDPWHPFQEDEPLGDMLAHVPASYPIAKLGSEIVARYCSRSFGLPVTIARMNSAYNERGGLPVMHLEAVAAGRPVPARWDPQPYSLIHGDDIAGQVAALLDAASSPATIVNWCGDDPVTIQEWTAYMGELLGTESSVEVTPFPGASRGAVADPTRRRAITGPCTVSWREGIRRTAAALYPDRVPAA